MVPASFPNEGYQAARKKFYEIAEALQFSGFQEDFYPATPKCRAVAKKLRNFFLHVPTTFAIVFVGH